MRACYARVLRASYDLGVTTKEVVKNDERLRTTNCIMTFLPYESQLGTISRDISTLVG